MKRRAVITGIECLTSLGQSVEETWESIKAGKCGIRKIEEFDTPNYSCQFGGKIEDFRLKRMSGLNMMNYSNQLELFCVMQACSKYQFEPDGEFNDNAIFLGNQIISIDKESLEIIASNCMNDGNIDFSLLGENIRNLPPLNGLKLLPTVPSHFISKNCNMHGEGNLLYNGETSGLLNLLLAAKEIESGTLDRAFVASVFTPFSPHEFLWLCGQDMIRKTVGDENPAHLVFPFDKRHCGKIYGEGVGAVIIESEESAKRHGRKVLAYFNGGVTNVFPGATFTTLTAEGFTQNILQALANARLDKTDIDVIFSNGTSYPQWDNAELKAVLKIWEDSIPGISCATPYVGDTCSASGVINCVFAVMSMLNNYHIQVMNFASAEEQFANKVNADLLSPASGSLQHCLISSVGQGGSYCSIILERGERNE